VKTNDAAGIPLRLGELVTVRGIVTVANEFGGPSYIQDNSGAIAVFGSSFSTSVAIGDEVVVSGTIEAFNGLTELGTPILHQVLSEGGAVTPAEATCADIAGDGSGGVETWEGMLVRLVGVVVRDHSGSTPPEWTVVGSGTNYRLVDASDTVDVRIDDRVDLANTPAPQSAFNLTGVVSQFRPTSPYVGGYQVMPRAGRDLTATGPAIVTPPAETEISPTALTIGWTTLRPGTSRLAYGRTAALELGLLEPDDSLRQEHAVRLHNLEPATIYHARAFSVADAETSAASPLIVSTASPPGSTGIMRAWFNKSVDTSIARGSVAEENADLVGHLVTLINGARRSLDASIYSLSGTPGEVIAGAMIAAKNRGVSVRVVCEEDNRYDAGNAFITLVAGGIAVLTDAFDPVLNGAGLMHNKFFVVDGRGGAPESSWVWTGSWNPTNSGTHEDYQNAIVIQDAALAGAYTREFDEMWGSSTDSPVRSLARFGSRKQDNTPHKFVIGGRDVESYFSPSDRTTSRIAGILSTARSSIAFALLTLTRDDLAASILAADGAGRKVRGVMDNATDPGSEYSRLAAAGIDVHLKSGTGLLHHKYAIVDGEDPAWDPVVITGSHNWSTSAETSNNENTLIIRDAVLASHYLQEFSARYTQFGGQDPIVVGVDDVDSGSPSGFSLSQNYPNPFNPATTIVAGIPQRVEVVLEVFDLLGRRVAEIFRGELGPGTYRWRFDGAGLASGVYVYRLVASGQPLHRTMMLLR
jgi:phosphatidylserine/phosphatidylglycerophosphate/cardiolipin synthase-like enzyme